jgi:hypothetical protein
LEARLAEPSVAREAVVAIAPEPAASATDADADAGESVAVIEHASRGDDPSRPTWPDESAEAAFLGEARERGESPAPVKVREETAEETDSKALPPLNELVDRIPAEVREVLDDLFRVKFTTVRRIPGKALKD